MDLYKIEWWNGGDMRSKDWQNCPALVGEENVVKNISKGYIYGEEICGCGPHHRSLHPL